MSDGDNLNTLYGFVPGWFTHPFHGQIPMGWGMGPSIIDLRPAVAEWCGDHGVAALAPVAASLPVGERDLGTRVPETASAVAVNVTEAPLGSVPATHVTVPAP
jgi:hypothetical protein